MSIYPYLTLICMLSMQLSAEEKKFEKLLDYENVTVNKIEKDSIRIMHQHGVTKIPIEDIPPEIREELGMSLDGVEEHRKKVAAANATAAVDRKILQLNKKILEASYSRIESATVSQVVNGGVLASVTKFWNGTYKEVPTYKEVKVGNGLSGYRTQRVKTGTKKVKNVSYYSVHDGWLIFVACDSSGFVDGSGFAGDVWSNGTYSYRSVLGAVKTIPKYTSNPRDVIKR